MTCGDNDIEIKNVQCNEGKCSDNYRYTEWSEWGQCSKKCLKAMSDISIKNRTRNCTDTYNGGE